MLLEILNVAYPTIHYKPPLRILPSPSVLSYCSHSGKRLTYEMSRTHLLQVVQKGGTVKNIKQKLYEHYYCGKLASSFSTTVVCAFVAQSVAAGSITPL